MPAVHAFLMTDIEGSTRAWQTDAVAMDELLARHDDLLNGAIVAARGRVFKHTGDGMCAVFDDPSDAVNAAVDAQRSFAAAGIKVRMGIHAGVATVRGDDYFGLTVNRCARVMGAAHGGQVLVTLTVEELVRDDLASDVSLRDLGVVRLRDLGQDDHLFQLVAPGLPDDFPPPPTAVAPGRVPVARSALIGRVTELAQLSELVDAGRLVTIVGPGGCGKTRLALEVLGSRQHDFARTVFADLSVTTDPGLVVGVIADALGMAAGGSSLDSEVVRFLESQAILLVLDNCEHVLDTVAPLIDSVLSMCPSNALLATSREPLGVHGEYVWRVPSLSSDDAVALFVERAVQGGAILDRDRDEEVIDEICARLDGIPLAIEIAAAHAAHMPLDSLRVLLDDHLHVLVGRDRHAVPRHRTLQSTLRWSFELLDDVHRALFRRLSVFAGSFTLADAGALVEREDPLPAQSLGGLVDKSLVVFDVRAGRYQLLETVQQFARAELDEAGETDETFERLYASLLAEAPGPWSCWLAGRRERGSIDINNVRAVLGWCESSGRPAAAGALAAAHLSLWFLPGRVDEALRWLRLPPAIEERLSLDERLAWRTAVSWMAFAAMDTQRILEIDEHLQLAPLDHPARGSLLFLKAWGQAWRDRDELRRLLSEVRDAPHAGKWWDRGWEYDIVRGLAALLDDRLDEAIDAFSGAVEHSTAAGLFDAARPRARMFLAVAYHLAGEPARVAAIVADLDLDDVAPGEYFSDLVAHMVVVIEAVGREDVASARVALGQLLAATAEWYPHVEGAFGIGVQSAAAVAYLAGRPVDAIVLLSGSHHHGLHRRFEGAGAIGRAYLRKSRAALPEEAVRSATQRGEAMSVRQLVQLANDVARDPADAGLPDAPSPR